MAFTEELIAIYDLLDDTRSSFSFFGGGPKGRCLKERRSEFLHVLPFICLSICSLLRAKASIQTSEAYHQPSEP